MKKLLLFFVISFCFTGLKAQKITAPTDIGFHIYRNNIFNDSTFFVVDIKITQPFSANASFRVKNGQSHFEKGAKGKGTLVKMTDKDTGLLKITQMGNMKFTKPKTVQLKIKNKH